MSLSSEWMRIFLPITLFLRNVFIFRRAKMFSYCEQSGVWNNNIQFLSVISEQPWQVQAGSKNNGPFHSWRHLRNVFCEWTQLCYVKKSQRQAKWFWHCKSNRFISRNCKCGPQFWSIKSGSEFSLKSGNRDTPVIREQSRFEAELFILINFVPFENKPRHSYLEGKHSS